MSGGGLRDRWGWQAQLSSQVAKATATRASSAKRGRESIDEIAARLGLAAPLGERVADEWVGGKPPAGGAALLQELRGTRDGRVAAIEDSGRLRTALDRFDEFLGRTGRVPFVDPNRPGGKVYNQETLDVFAEDVRRRGSRAAGHVGERISQGTVGGIVSAIKVLRERREDDAVFSATAPVRRVAAKHMRFEDGKAHKAPRKLTRAFRAHHFRECIRLGFDRMSARGMMEWAAALLAHNILLRSGEVCCVAAWAFEPSRDITWASFQWHEPSHESRGCAWFTVEVLAIKDQEFTNQAVPMPVRRRAGGHAMGADPLCPYDAVRALWLARAHLVPESERTYGEPSSTPFFVDAKGRPWTSGTTRELAERMGKMAGILPAETGGKMFRIGGATELRVKMGVARATTLLKDRGRWHDKDIGNIYSRALLEDHLDASAAMGDEGGSRDFEEVFAGWVQPATFR